MEFSAGVSRVELEANRMLRLAVERCLQIIGEAAGELSEDVWASAEEIPWLQIVGMGNRLAHAYFAINPDYLWQTIEEDLVPLIARVRVLLDESPGA